MRFSVFRQSLYNTEIYRPLVSSVLKNKSAFKSGHPILIVVYSFEVSDFVSITMTMLENNRIPGSGSHLGLQLGWQSPPKNAICWDGFF